MTVDMEDKKQKYYSYNFLHDWIINTIKSLDELNVYDYAVESLRIYTYLNRKRLDILKKLDVLKRNLDELEKMDALANVDTKIQS